MQTPGSLQNLGVGFFLVPLLVGASALGYKSWILRSVAALLWVGLRPWAPRHLPVPREGAAAPGPRRVQQCLEELQLHSRCPSAKAAVQYVSQESSCSKRVFQSKDEAAAAAVTANSKTSHTRTRNKLRCRGTPVSQPLVAVRY